MEIAIVKYNAGNTQSVIYALNRLGVSPTVTEDPEILARADKVIFPGVGEASTAMQFLKERKLDLLLPSLRQPVLGVCLGLQLLCRHSTENNTPCLGIFDIPVLRFPNEGQKVPQMGWNQVGQLKGPLFAGLENGFHAYFVHSYFAALSPDTIGVTEYGLPFSAALHRDNFYAVQFHPEKSSQAGAVVLGNFLAL